MEVQKPPGNGGHYSTDLDIDMVVIILPKKEVLVTLQMMHIGLVQIAPLPQSLVKDVDMIEAGINITKLSRAK